MITYYRFEVEFSILDELDGLTDSAREELSNRLFVNSENTDLGAFFEVNSTVYFSISSIFLDDDKIVIEAYMYTKNKKPLSEELWEKILYKHINELVDKFNHFMESIGHGVLKEIPVVTQWGISPL